MIIACIISFVVGAMIMMCAIGMVAIQKDKEPRNKVHFYIGRGSKKCYLYFGMPISLKNAKGVFVTYDTNFSTPKWIATVILGEEDFDKVGLKPKDYYNIPVGGIKEIFLNMED